MEEKNNQDLCLIKNMAQELGLTPLDIFMHWVETGRVKSLSLNVSYEDGTVAELKLSKPELVTNFGFEFNTDSLQQAKAEAPISEVNFDRLPYKGEEKGDDEHSPTVATEEIQIPSPVSEKDDESSISNGLGTSNPKRYGPNCIKSEQAINVKIGAYVYTTGAISPKYKAYGKVQIKGIVLSYSKDSLTIIKYIGSDLTSIDAVAQTKDNWRFLTYEECLNMVRYQDTLNDSLIKMSLKQINDSSMLLYRDKYNQLYGYDVRTKEVRRTLEDKTVGVSRTFSVYLAKDIKIA